MRVEYALVISDIDEILRRNKLPVEKKTKKAIEKFVRKGGRFIPITGGPFNHVPKELLNVSEIVFSEHGGMKYCKGKGNIIPTDLNQIRFLGELKKRLGISAEDGLEKIKEGTVIIEGIRHASLTLLFGSPSHYPGITTTADFNRVLSAIESLIKQERYPFFIYPGRGTNYKWIDVITTTKKLTIQGFLENRGNPDNSKVFYLGDRGNDFEVMCLSGITPVGFTNCDPRIIALSREKGIFIPKDAPKGGVPLFFQYLLDGKL